MSEPVLEATRLNAYYGAAQILFGVCLELRAGEVAALMGRNGAGKSTTMKALMGFIRREAEKISFRNQNIVAEKTYKIARAGLAFVPEERRIFTDLTVLENLDVARQPARLNSVGKQIAPWTIDRILTLFPNLADARTRLANQISGGEQQMLAIARALMGNPYALLLDEPSEGVAPVMVDRISDLIAALKRDGLSILLSEQNLRFAAEISDRAYVLEKGEIKFSGLMGNLAADETLRRQYLEI